MRDENTKVRLQLKDPFNIKRSELGYADPLQEAGLVDEFTRVQSQSDVLTL